MCNWLSDMMERYPNWINLIWFSDEAHFHLNGATNNHNNIFWWVSIYDLVTYHRATTFVFCFTVNGIVELRS